MVPEPGSARNYAVHEASHAVVSHLCGFRVNLLCIAPETARGKCEIDRGFDPDEACFFVRGHARDERTVKLLPLLKRDLAGRLAGMIGDGMYGIQGSEAEYRRDRECANNLARDILHATWVRSELRPPFAERERIAEYHRRMESFVRDRLLNPYRHVLERLANKLELQREMTAEEVFRVFDRVLPFAVVGDESLP